MKYKRRRKSLKLISYLLLILNLILLEFVPVAWIAKIKITTFQSIMILIFWAISIVVLQINELVNNN